MKSSLICLLLITVSAFAVANDVPTDEQIKNAWGYNQGAIIGMVQKLYIVENAVPVIDFPALSIVETKQGEIVVDYNGPMVIEIGTVPDVLMYEVTMEPKDVTVAMQPPPFEMPWWGYGLMIVLPLAGGFIGGVVTGFSMAR